MCSWRLSFVWNSRMMRTDVLIPSIVCPNKREIRKSRRRVSCFSTDKRVWSIERGGDVYKCPYTIHRPLWWCPYVYICTFKSIIFRASGPTFAFIRKPDYKFVTSFSLSFLKCHLKGFFFFLLNDFNRRESKNKKKNGQFLYFEWR